ncbi:stage II sporulation protein M [Neobacillus fumarioli]|uniref:stage II sporulation protein M n=1 Tax=Neobacillus fumarioli TaxID=105229 RepID=UPI00082D861B|nr:stage II sporulation protein M [Neobacillus fumarioli]
MKKRLYQSKATSVSSYIREYSSIFLFVVVLFLMGVIFGAIVVNSMGYSQKEDLYYYLSQFFGQVSEGKIADHNDLFMQSLLHNSKFIGLIWVLGISVVGLPVILILLFVKGMVVGFTVGFLVSQMGWKGFALAAASILPQNLINIPIFIVMAGLSVIFSLRMIKKQFVKKYAEPIMPFFKGYILALIAAVIFISLASGIEAYLSPSLMKSVVGSSSLK